MKLFLWIRNLKAWCDAVLRLVFACAITLAGIGWWHRAELGAGLLIASRLNDGQVLALNTDDHYLEKMAIAMDAIAAREGDKAAMRATPKGTYNKLKY